MGNSPFGVKDAAVTSGKLDLVLFTEGEKSPGTIVQPLYIEYLCSVQGSVGTGFNPLGGH